MTPSLRTIACIMQSAISKAWVIQRSGDSLCETLVRQEGSSNIAFCAVAKAGGCGTLGNFDLP